MEYDQIYGQTLIYGEGIYSYDSSTFRTPVASFVRRYDALRRRNLFHSTSFIYGIAISKFDWKVILQGKVLIEVEGATYDEFDYIWPQYGGDYEVILTITDVIGGTSFAQEVYKVPSRGVSHGDDYILPKEKKKKKPEIIVVCMNAGRDREVCIINIEDIPNKGDSLISVLDIGEIKG